MYVTTPGGVGLLECPAPPPSPAQGAALGFATRAVVEATAEQVTDLVGIVPRLEPVWRRGRPDDLFEWTRPGYAYRLHLSAGTVALDMKAPRPFDDDGDQWHDLRRNGWHDRSALRWLEDEDDEPEADAPPRVITEWSRRSRARMIRALAEIDHGSWSRPEWRLALITLTLPGRWLAVAPTGSHYKAMLHRLRDRWIKEGLPWEGAWKQEYQERGAPHTHMMMRVPDEDWRSRRGETFRQWLSRSWAECVAAPDPDERARHVLAGTNVDFGFRGTDARRIAVYFLKHSAKTADGKEYQHRVPVEWSAPGAGPGRFWGVVGLDRPRQVIELPGWAWLEARRVLRHIHRAARARVALSRRAASLPSDVTDATRRATLQRLQDFGAGRDRLFTSAQGGGWVLAVDAPLLAYQLARWLAQSSSGGVLE